MNCLAQFILIGRRVVYSWIADRYLHKVELFSTLLYSFTALQLYSDRSSVLSLLSLYRSGLIERVNGSLSLVTLCSLWCESLRAAYGPAFTQGNDHADAEPLWFCAGFQWADQSQPSRLRRVDGRLRCLGGVRQALAVDARRVREDVRGP